MLVIATWNMCGGTKTPYIKTVLKDTGANVLCVQECGDFGVHLKGTAPIIGPQGRVIGLTGNFNVGHGFMECVWWQNPYWAAGGIAILSNITPEATAILQPIQAPFNPTHPRSMPAMTVKDPGTGNSITIFSIHSPSQNLFVHAPNVCAWNNAQIANLNNNVAGAWACVGDFNADPTTMAFQPPANSVVVHGGQATQEGGGILDYAVTNATLTFVQATQLVSTSDHWPQKFQW